jgi:hypothetical protein
LGPTHNNPARRLPNRVCDLQELAERVVIDLSSAFGRLLNVAIENASGPPDKFPRFADNLPDHKNRLRDLHRRSFNDWLTFPLGKQLADLSDLLAAQTVEQRQAMMEWLDARGYVMLLPAGTWAPDQDLFLHDLDVIVLLLPPAA